jgi:hypothetical protein
MPKLNVRTARSSCVVCPAPTVLDVVRRVTGLVARHSGQTEAVEDVTLLGVEWVG